MFNLINKAYNEAMEMTDLFNLLHNAVEAQGNGKKISQKEMAQKLGISMRSYQDWRLGNAKPQAAKAVLEMLGMLDDDEIIRVVRKINKLGKES
jgi:DNA-binding transcriptional regulator YiaG